MRVGRRQRPWKEVVAEQRHAVRQQSVCRGTDIGGTDALGDARVDGGAVTASHLNENGTRLAIDWHIDRLAPEVLHERARRIVRVEPLQALEIVLYLQRAGDVVADGLLTRLRHVLVVERLRDGNASDLSDHASVRRVKEGRNVVLQHPAKIRPAFRRNLLELDEAIGARERRRLEPGLDSGGEYAQDGTLRQTAIVHAFRIESNADAIHIHDLHAHFDGANDLRD